MSFRRLLLRGFAGLGALILVLLLYACATAMASPVVRRTAVALDGWPAGEPPLRAVLISDIHVAGPDMPPSRLRRIVGEINVLRPDVVLIAGDLVSDKRISTRTYSMAEAAAPLAGLRTRLGSFAVLGNHDHWRDPGEARAALRAAGVSVLDNDAARIGPLALGGIDDSFTGQDDVGAAVRRMRAVGGPMVLLSHSPDPFPGLPQDVQLMLAGHTHCGQISLPYFGPLTTMSAHGRRYACGLIEENGRRLIVGAGLGTSMLPLRLGAVSDLWVVELGPAGVAR